MIAVDTSSFVAFFAGESGRDVEWVRRSIQDEALVIPPVVIAELFSARNLCLKVKKIITGIPILDLAPGFWQRTGEVRAKLLAKGKKARLADTMIAVYCIDHNLPLIARDGDYRHFVRPFGLDLRSE
jgi:predicted nucleic acid-binding protein